VPSHPIVPVSPDFRIDPPLMGGEREVLVAFLDYQRGTLLRKVSGLTPAQLCERSVPPSPLSAIGLVRHLTEVERYWLTEVLLADDLPDLYCSADDVDGDFHNGTPETAPFDVATWITTVDTCRAHVADWPDLDAPAKGTRRGSPLSLRWILIHLVEEYARHLGHLDLIREAIDGVTGE
jgi:hypothetical protein